MSGSNNYGKDAEKRLTEWLDRPEDGYSWLRIPDQMSGFYKVSRNICDFTLYKYPYCYYIESKSTEHDRFDFSELTDDQREGLWEKSKIDGCFGLVVVLFVYYKRAFFINIKDITDPDTGLLSKKSINIKKIAKWGIPYWEIQTIPSRKLLLDYTGDLPDFTISS